MTPLLLLLLAAHGHAKHAKPAKAETTPSNAAIEKAVATHQAEVQDCYAYASAGKALNGKVALHWVVNADGSVSQMRLDSGASTLKDMSLVECIEDKLSSWYFPTMEKGEQVSHTWEFGAASTGPAATTEKKPAEKSKHHRRHR